MIRFSYLTSFLPKATALIIILAMPILHSSRNGYKAVALPTSSELVAEVNQLRASNGLPPYSINPILSAIAQSHADYQANSGSVTHIGSDGSRPFQRALAAGYQVAGDLSLGGYFSENIAAGLGMTPGEAVQMWQSDAPHLNTMLSSTLKDIGAGVSIIGGTVYFTIDVGLSTSQTQGTNFPILTSGVIPFIPQKPFQTSTPQPNGSIIHKVQLGETIWALAQYYQVTESDIITLNGLSTNLIYVGDVLVIKPPIDASTLESVSTVTHTIVTNLTRTAPLHTKDAVTYNQQSEVLPSGQKYYIIGSFLIFSSLLVIGYLVHQKYFHNNS